MIVGIDHAEISVRDFDKTIEFYTRLGFVKAGEFKKDGETIQVQLNAGSISLDIVKCPEGKEPGLEHIAFLADDVDRTVGEMKKMGVTITLEPITSERSGRRLAAFKDIDGIMHQLAKPMVSP